MGPGGRVKLDEQERCIGWIDDEDEDEDDELPWVEENDGDILAAS